MTEMKNHKDCCCSAGKHEHHHEHEEGSLKSKIFLIAVTVVLLVGAVLVEKNCNLATWQLLIVYLIPYLLIGRETLGEAL